MASVEVLPALLVKTRQEAEARLTAIRGAAPWIHVDALDGQFAPNITLGANELAGLLDDFSVEVHLMVQDPTLYIQEWYQAGAKRLLLHVESSGDLKEHIRSVRKLGMSVGACLNPQTPIDTIIPVVPDIDCVMLLAVEPGFGGQAFKPEVFNKARELHAKFPSLPLELDGGVTLEVARQGLENGIASFVVNSYLFSSSDPVATLQHMRHSLAAALDPGQSAGKKSPTAYT